MNASTTELYQQGKLDQALKSARHDVESNQADPAFRYLLFELLLLAEDFNAAERELLQVQALDSTLEVGRDTASLTAARQRHELLTTGVGNVLILGGEQPSYFEFFFAAQWAIHHKKPKEAANCIAAGAADLKPRAGSIDGERFSALLDADSFLGPFLEVLAGSEYAWIPFEPDWPWHPGAE